MACTHVPHESPGGDVNVFRMDRSTEYRAALGRPAQQAGQR